MITPELADYSAVCHTSYWRPLRDGRERPGYYIMLSGQEVVELAQTGGFAPPESAVPESVRAWREKQEAAEEEGINRG